MPFQTVSVTVNFGALAGVAQAGVTVAATLDKDEKWHRRSAIDDPSHWRDNRRSLASCGHSGAGCALICHRRDRNNFSINRRRRRREQGSCRLGRHKLADRLIFVKGAIMATGDLALYQHAAREHAKMFKKLVTDRRSIFERVATNPISVQVKIS